MRATTFEIVAYSLWVQVSTFNLKVLTSWFTTVRVVVSILGASKLSSLELATLELWPRMSTFQGATWLQSFDPEVTSSNVATSNVATSNVTTSNVATSQPETQNLSPENLY